MNAVKIKENIYWVGGIDWNLRNFHGYLTQRGSTYNAFLIIDEKITLIDTVKHYLADEMFERISKVIDPSKIDYIVCNHVEMDHSGALPKVLEYCPNATIITSQVGADNLKLHYETENWKIQAIKKTETINIGKRNLNFVVTPMVHWPDNMITYCPEEEILFSNDGFGQHIASFERFDDEFPLNILMEENAKYYANIVLPYGESVKKELEIAKTLKISIICPSHGIIWRKNIDLAIQTYEKWANNFTENKALIIYDTMWGSTESIAKALYKAFEIKNIAVELLNLQFNHISDIMTKVLTAKYICIGSPTLNNEIMPSVSGFLTYLKGLAPKDRIGLAFGSYGWSMASINKIENILKDECKFTMLNSIKHKYVPKENDLKRIENIIFE